MIANGVPLFKEPRVQRAKRTELLLGVILSAMLLGLAILAVHFHVGLEQLADRTSQIIGYSIGTWFYDAISITVTIVLAPANTSFGGLPVLASLLARITISRTPLRCGATASFSAMASGRSRSCLPACSSPSEATRTP